MSFLHEDPEFADLLRIVSRDRGLAVSLVEKDYWVTHALWALHETGLEVWFKGGTSLSKGFGIIQRFSEDLDLRIDSGKVVGLPHVDNWKSDSQGQIRKRRAYFEKLAVALLIPSCSTHINIGSLDRKARGATYNVEYPGRFTRDLVEPFHPFVLLEVGRARVHPWVERRLSSFVHDQLEASGQLADYRSNCPESVRCLHPIVTLIEKIEAMARRFPSADPAGFIRHYEDAARIIEKESQLPQLEDGLGDLIGTLLKDRTIRRFPDADDPAFTLVDPELRKTLERAHGAIAPMFWGERLSLNNAAGIIRDWLTRVG